MSYHRANLDGDALQRASLNVSLDDTASEEDVTVREAFVLSLTLSYQLICIGHGNILFIHRDMINYLHPQLELCPSTYRC
jgi:hypothetical protein